MVAAAFLLEEAMIRQAAPSTNDALTRRFYAEIWPAASFVLRSALILAGNRSEADDLAQDTMLKAFRSLDQFTPGTNAESWLLTILRHAWVDRVRSRKARPESALSEAADDVAAPSVEEDPAWAEPEELLSAFGDQDIIGALQELPPEIRWTLLLVDVQGLDHAEAAEVLGVPTGTIKSRAHRGRVMLRSTLAPRAKELGLLPRGSQGVPIPSDTRKEAKS